MDRVTVGEVDLRQAAFIGGHGQDALAGFQVGAVGVNYVADVFMDGEADPPGAGVCGAAPFGQIAAAQRRGAQADRHLPRYRLGFGGVVDTLERLGGSQT